MPASIAKRYSVLVMDVSGSMYGNKIQAAKTAAKEFCNAVLANGSEDYIAIVEYDNTAKVRCDFTKDLTQLTNSIDSMGASGGTNFYTAFETATNVLDGVTESGVLAKSMIFLTDGYPEHGPTSATGKYTSSDFAFYGFANKAYEAYQAAADKDYEIYSIGFQTNSNTEKFLKDLQNKGYYNASDVNKLYDTFKKIANVIVVSGVNVELKDDDIVIDSVSTTNGACQFKFSANPGTYTLSVSAPGYVTEEQTVEIKSGETVSVGDICLKLETK